MAATMPPARLPNESVHANSSADGELNLEAVLYRIVAAAADLVDARYAALGVLESPSSNRLSHFITVGLSSEEIAAIGPLPTGKGVLGMLISDPLPKRLSNLTLSAGSVGFPPNHPPMTTFLGVPIRVRDEVFGILYLAEKRRGAFTRSDERAVSALAAAACMAIANSHLHEAGIVRERWLAAAADMTTELLALPETRSPLDIIDSYLRTVAPGFHPFVRVTSETDDGGLDAGTKVRVISAQLSRQHEPDATLGLVVPEDIPDSDAATVAALLHGFAEQAALALRVADGRTEAEQLAVSDDRDRIARELHDLVIQSLFASGMSLESAVRLIDNPVAAERVHRVVDQLDSTIREIRSAIYMMQHSPLGSAPSGLRMRVMSVVDASVAGLGFAPRVEIEGPLDAVIDDDLATHVEAVLTEALSNTARHAGASRVCVAISAAHGTLRVSIDDDGIGMPSGGRRSGLRNLATRAESRGGTCELSPAEGGGTRLVWQVPTTRPTG